MAVCFFFPQIPRTIKNIQQTGTAGKMEVCAQRHTAKFSSLENLLTEAWNFHRCLSSARIAWLTCSAVFAIQNIFVDGSRCGRGFPFTAFENTYPHSHFQKRKTYTKNADPHAELQPLWVVLLALKGPFIWKATLFSMGSVVWPDFRTHASFAEAPQTD